MKLATAYVEVVVDTAKAKSQGKKDVQSLGNDLGSTFGQIFGAAAFAGGIAKSIGAASDLNEQVNRSKLIFGQSTKEIDAYAKNAAEKFGLSKEAFRDATSTLGGLLQNLGLTREASLKWSVNLTKLGSDLGSAFNKAPAEAVAAIGSALRGESEPIRAFNVILDEARIKQEAVSLGLYSGVGAIDANAKAQATLKLIMDQTVQSQGDFANTADGAANAQRIAAAKAEDSAASLGQNFLPIYEKIVKVVGLVAEGFGHLPAPIQTGVVALVGLVALAGPVLKTVELMKDLKDKLYDAETGVTKLGKGLGAAAGVIALAVATWQAYEQGVNQAKERQDDFIASAQKLSDLGNEQFARDFYGLLGDAALQAALDSKTLDEVTDDLAKTNVVAARRAIELAKANGMSQTFIDALTLSVLDQEKALAEAAAKESEFGDTLATSLPVIDATTEALEHRGLAAYTAARADEEAKAATEAAAKAEEERKAALDELTGTLDEQSGAFHDVATAADELRQALDNLLGPAMDVEEAARNYQAALDGILPALKDNGKTLDINTEKGRANREMIDKNIKSIIDYGVAQVGAGQSVEGASAAVQLMITDLENQLTAAGYTRAEIEAYIAQLNLTPESITTAVQLANDELMRQKLSGLLAQMTTLDKGAISEVQALIDAGSYAEAERLLNFLARGRSIQLWINASSNANPNIDPSKQGDGKVPAKPSQADLDAWAAAVAAQGGGFASGGTVGGQSGKPQAIVAHPGEKVLPTKKVKGAQNSLDEFLIWYASLTKQEQADFDAHFGKDGAFPTWRPPRDFYAEDRDRVAKSLAAGAAQPFAEPGKPVTPTDPVSAVLGRLYGTLLGYPDPDGAVADAGGQGRSNVQGGSMTDVVAALNHANELLQIIADAAGNAIALDDRRVVQTLGRAAERIRKEM